MASANVNFCFPVRRLENARLFLEPFDLSTHAAPYAEGCKDHPEIFQWLPYGDFTTLAEFEAMYKTVIEPDPTKIMFAVLAKSSPSDQIGTVAGIIGLLNASPENALVELGFVIPSSSIPPYPHLPNREQQITTLPAFQRTLVTSNALGLLLAYTLDPPPLGLGLRRSQWQAHALNEASRRVALRMQYTFEGIQRFQRVIPITKKGSGFDVSRLPESTGTVLGQARDTAIYAHYCDEWAEKREVVFRLMEPRS